MPGERTRVNDERKYVVKPLRDWFAKQRTRWDVYLPTNPTSERGWDLEARRKNLDLLVEAKYIKGPFISSFSQLVTSPLTNRRQHFMQRKRNSWCANACWAIGSSDEIRNVYQIIFDYFVRAPAFWRHYCQDLSVKYVYFVKNTKVMRITFQRLLSIAEVYAEEAQDKAIARRREIAHDLMKNYRYT